MSTTLTLVDLAELISSGFDRVYERFSQVDTRLDRVNLRIDQVEQRMGAFERILTDHSERFFSLERQFAIEIARHDVRLTAHEREIGILHERLPHTAPSALRRAGDYRWGLDGAWWPFVYAGPRGPFMASVPLPFLPSVAQPFRP